MRWHAARRAAPCAVGFAVAVVVSVAGCGARAPRAGGPLPGGAPPARGSALTVGGVAACQLVAAPAAGPSTRAGGLSGLLFEPASGTYLAVSDQEVPRLYRLRLDVDGQSCRPAVLDTILLRWPGPAAPAARARDFEDLAWWPGGDLLLVSDTLKVTSAFVKVGLSGDFGSTWFLTQKLGPRARDFALLSPVLRAEDAQRLGLVSRVVADAELDAEGQALARHFAAGPGITLAHIKANLNMAEQGASLAQALDHEAIRHIRCSLTEDHKEAACAFVEKRAPRFAQR